MNVLLKYWINNYGRSKDSVKLDGHTADIKTMEIPNKILLTRSPWEGQLWHPIMTIRSHSRNWEVYFEKNTEHLRDLFDQHCKKLIAI